MSQYLLASHVYLCVTSDHAVLLDLKRDKYVGVGRSQMKLLAERVKGWPAMSASRESSERVDSLLSQMLSAGMLTTDATAGKAAAPINIAWPQATLSTLDHPSGAGLFEARPAITFAHFMLFLRASIAARMALRWRPIASVVAKVKSRKVRRGTAKKLDFGVARMLVAAFVHLRPLLFTTRDACLADSLALLNFLAYYEIFPTWVFAVQTGPFAAHCWVQEGDLVFNDTPDHVRRFTPILAI
jgi:hypothetical protein